MKGFLFCKICGKPIDVMSPDDYCSVCRPKKDVKKKTNK